MAPAGAPSEGYRVSRWARLALTITVLAAVVVVTASSVGGTAPTSLVDVTVGPGDTLWSIAQDASPDRDPRAVIDEIRQLNDVPTDLLPVGIVLRVPSDGD
jgi:LysM repeat protein